MRKYILSVDKKGITGLEIEKMLKGFDVHVMNVPDAQKVERAISNGTRDYSLVVWTVNAGEEHSFKIIKKLRDEGSLRNIPLIVVSDSQKKNDAVMASGIGAIYYATRPCDEPLLLKISDVLGIRMQKPFASIRDSVVAFTLNDIMDKEIKSSLRGGYPLSILIVSINKEGADEELRFEKTDIMAAVFKRRLRDSDIIIHTESGIIFILLPFTGSEDLNTVRDKVKELLETHSVIRKAIEGYCTRISSVTCPDNGKTREQLLGELNTELESEY